MIYSLPKSGQKAIELSHFPTKHQAFIFRALEYVSKEKIAKILKTTPENVQSAAFELGLQNYASKDLWLKKGYITIIRRMWHILPYSQLLELLDMDEETFAAILRDEDFLDIKLGNKPICDEVVWRELTEEEQARTSEIKKIMQALDMSGKAPFEFEYTVPEIIKNGNEIFKTRMIYAFSGLYHRAFDVDSREYLPDEQLKAYASLGINGIWTQGVFSSLCPFPFDESLSSGYKNRLENMRALTERLDKFGIKLYLYINEPRYMPLSFFDNHQDILGHVKGDAACLCTSTEKVKNYLRDSIECICRAVPLIGGFFTITRSENITNCYSHSGYEDEECLCPRCGRSSVAEVIADVIKCFRDGARRVSNDIKIFAWSWGWGDQAENIIRRLPKDVILLSQSELGVPFSIGGINGKVIDYSMSIIGPGEKAKNEWKTARECGLETGAKLQVNTTWEASTVPAIPVSPLITEHMKRLQKEDVKHLLLSWTLGGYPGRNLAEIAKYFYYNNAKKSDDCVYYEAEKQFSKAFKEFPFHIDTLYYGPQNAGPSTLLFEKSTGYHAKMTCFAYDHLERWRSIYPIDIFESQFKKLCTEWKKGLDMLPEGDESELSIMATATYCLFKSSLNQIRFIQARDEERFGDAIEIAKDELEITKTMLNQMNKNAAIGYEAANHYYFSKGQLAEKIVNCHYIIDRFSKKI